MLQKFGGGTESKETMKLKNSQRFKEKMAGRLLSKQQIAKKHLSNDEFKKCQKIERHFVHTSAW